MKNCVRTESPVTMEMKSRFNEEETIRLLHGAIGMVTESSETLDVLKKHLFYGKPLDKTNIFEELGDTFWYISIICDVMGFKMEDIMETNINKLKKRYPEKFTEKDAIIRDLDGERELLEEGFK